MKESELKSSEFRRQREGRWRELERILARAEKRSVLRLTSRELHALPVLYRATLSSLSVARSISLDRNVLQYLEGLASRAFFLVYSPEERATRVLVRFFRATFPQAVRELRGWVCCSLALTLIGIACGFSMVRTDPDRFYDFVDAGYAQGRDPTATTEELRGTLYTHLDSPSDQLTAFAAYLFTHNAGIGLLCFALGVIPGVFVIFLLLQNGLLLGAFAALFDNRGLSTELWAWLLPHGVTELLAVVLCGGAGLGLGMSLVFPGESTRLRSLARQGRRAAIVAIGCVALFALAALIEGYFRQLVHDVTARYTLATATGVWWLLYFARSGRSTA